MIMIGQWRMQLQMKIPEVEFYPSRRKISRPKTAEEMVDYPDESENDFTETIESFIRNTWQNNLKMTDFDTFKSQTD